MKANVFIYDVIGEDTTLKGVRDQLAMYSNYDEVIMHINSVGGDVREGWAIHDYIKSLGKKIITKIDGKCYSIATVLALAGDERFMSENSEFMIHNPWVGNMTGDASELKKMSNELSKEEQRLASYYASKSGNSFSVIAELMKNETYMDSDQAIKMGFANSKQEKLKAVALINMEKNKEKKALGLIAELKKALGMETETHEKKSLELSLEDGTNVFVDTEDGDIVGKAIFITNEEGEMTPAPSGEHALSDGRVITVAEGLITDVKEGADEVEALKKANAELMAKIEEMEKDKHDEIEALKAEQEEQRKILAQKVDTLSSLVMTEEAPKALKEKTVSAQAEPKHKFDTLIQK